MIEIKNSDLKSILLTLAGFNKEGKMVQGLLTENVSLGLKRRLQKIHTEAGKAWTEFQKDIKEINDANPIAKDAPPEATKLIQDTIEKELAILLDEKVKLNAEKASMEFIEAIVTSKFYDTTTLELIAE